MKRKTPLWDSASPALTPELPEIKPTGQLTRDELVALVHNQKRVIASERKRNAVLLGCLGRYISLLEGVCADQRQAFIELHNPLVPSAAAVIKKVACR